jgi:hypothetical protein
MSSSSSTDDQTLELPDEAEELSSASEPRLSIFDRPAFPCRRFLLRCFFFFLYLLGKTFMNFPVPSTLLLPKDCPTYSSSALALISDTIDLHLFLHGEESSRHRISSARRQLRFSTPSLDMIRDLPSRIGSSKASISIRSLSDPPFFLAVPHLSCL